MNLDRFAVGKPDNQEAKVKAYCEACGGEIYEGDMVYKLTDGAIVHGRDECLVIFIDADYMAVEEALGVA